MSELPHGGGGIGGRDSLAGQPRHNGDGGFFRRLQDVAAIVDDAQAVGPIDAVARRNVTWESVAEHTEVVLAFGGMGGIAVGFAAKDLLANLFGGLMIHLDRPFNVGEMISSPDRQIEDLCLALAGTLHAGRL